MWCNNNEINPKECEDITKINFMINIMGERERSNNEILKELSDNDVPKSNQTSSSKEHGNKAKIFNKGVDHKTLVFPKLCK